MTARLRAGGLLRSVVLAPAVPALPVVAAAADRVRAAAHTSATHDGHAPSDARAQPADHRAAGHVTHEAAHQAAYDIVLDAVRFALAWAEEPGPGCRTRSLLPFGAPP